MSKRVAVLCVFLGLILVTSAPAQRKALTIERLYGQPSLSGSTTAGMQWSPDGTRLSYMQRGAARGAASDVWAMDAATGQRTVLVEGAKLAALLPQGEERGTVATGLGRGAPQRFQWAPDGNALLFVAQGNLYWWDLKTQTGKALTTTGAEKPVEDPKISPSGKLVSFIRDYDLWVVDIT